MSVLTAVDTTDRQVLRIKLEALVGVDRALIEEDVDVVWLLCEPGFERIPVVPLKAAARDALSALGLDPAAVTIEVAARVEGVPRRRVRLGPVERVSAESGRVGVRVVLQWQGTTYTGEVSGVDSRPAELRTAAQATIDALASLIEDRLDVRLIGIKRFRKFDEELIAVSITETDLPDRRFVGTVIAADDPIRAAAMAVLNALNRVLGNYLVRTD